MDTFELHAQLEQDCLPMGDLKLSKLLLLNDSRFPWFILVPRVGEVSEIVDLSRDDLISYQIESNLVAKMLRALFSPDKLNIASIGNVVPQLHIHHIARFKTDTCWPDPVWGQQGRTPYTEDQIAEITANVSQHLGRSLAKVRKEH